MTQTVRSLNATTADDSPTFESPEVDFQRFDRFPPALRWRIANNNTKLAAAGFERHYDWARTRGGSGLTIHRIDEIEINEIAVFAGQHRALHGYELPFVKADASIQRYGQLGPSLHPPRRYGAPIFRPQNRKRVSRRALRVAKEAA
jgi:hypothetical protein